ncbi:Hypothetical protein mma_1778 [Janthinobacterium sp. Marseille]|nr:hypothetical protein [Janthinobacterium sp. Marseille]ABR91909.1 Hypothetical protein mma_1778 [Janthinobacterium sp. Marseille]
MSPIQFYFDVASAWILSGWYRLALLIFWTAYLLYWLWRWLIADARRCKEKMPRPLGANEQYGIEYQKLLTAVLGDHRVAARLIGYEHSLAGSAGIGKAEAVRRALDRLSHDRSRGRWK